MTLGQHTTVLALLDDVVGIMSGSKEFPQEGFDKLAKAMRIVEQSYYAKTTRDGKDEDEVYPLEF